MILTLTLLSSIVFGQNTASFRQRINQDLPSNNSKAITAAKLRAVFTASANAIDSVYTTFSLANSLGEYNASTGVATVTQSGATSTPTSAPAFNDGKYFDVVVAGAQSITGTSVAMTVGGKIIVRGTKWGYIPPSDLALSTANEVKFKVDDIKLKTDNTLVRSINLADKSKLVSGSLFGTTGTIQTNANWRRFSELIPVNPSTNYKIVGINTTYVGSGYNSTGVANSTTFTEQIGTNSGTKTSLSFTTGPTTRYLGINTDATSASNSANTVMLYEYGGVDKAYQPFGTYLDVNAIRDAIPGVTYNADFAPVKTRAEAVTHVSPNLIDKSTLISGSAFGNATGAIGASASGKRTGYIPVTANADMYLQGVKANFLGNIYDANFVRLRKIAEPLAGIATATEQGFNTGANAAFVGINISNQEISLPGQFDDTAMLTYGTSIKPYEPFGTYVPFAKVAAIPAPHASVYYAYDNSTSQFTIYCQYPNKPNTYFGFFVRHTVDAGIRQDVWRVYGGQLYSFNGTTMTSQNKTMLLSLENEYVYQQTGKADHVGGFHGDEILDDVLFFVDDLPIAIPSANVALTACTKFHYRQKSKMYEMEDTPTTPGVVQNEHVKISTFTKGEFSTRNTVKWNASLSAGGIDIALGYVGLLCVGSSNAAKVYSRRSMAVLTTAGADAFLFNENAGSNELFYYNETERLAASVVSQINSIIENGVDKTATYNNDAVLICWDRPTDRKYYRRFANKKAYPGDVWDVQLKFTFNSLQ